MKALLRQTQRGGIGTGPGGRGWAEGINSCQKEGQIWLPEAGRGLLCSCAQSHENTAMASGVLAPGL